MAAAAAALAIALVMGGCGGSESARQSADAIRAGDTCAVCGMYIAKYAGPRGEAYITGYDAPLKFGSTRDFFAYVTQPDTKHSLESVFVQDSARIDWAHPSGAPDTFIDARKAYYVGWQPMEGAMGPTFASFASRQDAERFIGAHGGALLSYDQITPTVVSELGYACPKSGGLPGGAGGAGCAADPHGSRPATASGKAARPMPMAGMHAPATASDR